MRTLFVFILSFLAVFQVKAQELNCSVLFITDQIQLTDKKIFDELKEQIFEFMNSRQWTDKNYEIEERIECNFQFNFSEYDISSNQFKGTLQITSSRPTYKSDYNTIVMNVVDKNISFGYSRNARLDYVQGRYMSELSSILSYYAYMIIGNDFDTYSLEGGSVYFNEAQDIVSKAQLSGGQGWKAADGNSNRFWLVENILQPQFKPLRKLMYDYHRLGLDVMHQNAVKGKEVIAGSMKGLEKVHRVRPLSYNLQTFFQAKSSEIVKMFSKENIELKQELYNTLRIVDPSRLKDYDKMLKGK